MCGEDRERNGLPSGQRSFVDSFPRSQSLWQRLALCVWGNVKPSISPVTFCLSIPFLLSVLPILPLYGHGCPRTSRNVM